MLFKDETVAEIRCVAPLLLRMEAFEWLQQLLRRADSLIGKDQLAGKKMFKLHLVWMRLPPANTDSSSAVFQAQQNVFSMLEEATGEEMQCLLGEIEEPELRGFLSDLKGELIQSFHDKMKESTHICKNWIDQELARRLVNRLGNDDVFTQLCDLLVHNVTGVP